MTSAVPWVRSWVGISMKFVLMMLESHAAWAAPSQMWLISSMDA